MNPIEKLTADRKLRRCKNKTLLDYLEKQNRLIGKIALGIHIFNFFLVIAIVVDVYYFGWTVFGLLK